MFLFNFYINFFTIKVKSNTKYFFQNTTNSLLTSNASSSFTCIFKKLLNINSLSPNESLHLAQQAEQKTT